jgi:hypothetical protein
MFARGLEPVVICLVSDVGREAWHEGRSHILKRPSWGVFPEAHVRRRAFFTYRSPRATIYDRRPRFPAAVRRRHCRLVQ